MCNRRTQVHQIQMHATNPNDVTEQDEHGNNHTCMRHTQTHSHIDKHTVYVHKIERFLSAQIQLSKEDYFSDTTKLQSNVSIVLLLFI